MNDLHRDPDVARALDRLPVPEHRAGFWDELGARLDAEDGLDPAGITTRLASRWRAPHTLLVAMAAALALVLGTAVVTVNRDEGKRVRVGNAGQTTEPPTTNVPTTEVPATGSSQTRATPDGAVNAWLDALGRGDEHTAAALLGPKSRRYIEALGGNVEGFMRESEEGYGAWGASPDRASTEVDLGIVDGAATTIVIVTGTWRGEGINGFRSDAIPAVRFGGGWIAEPMAFDPQRGGRLTVDSPAPRERGGSELSSLDPDDVITVGAEGDGDFYFSLDDSEPVRVAGARAGGGVRATWDPPGAMSAQTHLLMVAYADGDTLTAFAGRFTVGG